MKVAIVFAALAVAVALADPIPWSEPTALDNHYQSHQGSVAVARRGVSERLQEIGVNDAQYVAPGSNDLQQSVGANGEPLCTVSCANAASEASSSSSRSDVEEIDQSNYGVGYVGFNAQENANSDFASQSEYSQNTQHSESANNPAALVPISVSGVGGESERYSSHSEHISESQTAQAPQQAIIYQPAAPVSNSRYVNRVHQQRIVQEAKPAPIPIIQVQQPYGGSSERYSANHVSHTSEVQQPQPAVVHVAAYPVPSGGSERSYIRSERITEQKTAAPQPQHTIIYTVPAPSVGSSESRISHSERLTQQHRAIPTPIIYAPAPQRASERYISHAEQYQNTHQQQQPSAAIYTYPAAGGANSLYSNRHESERFVTVDAQQPQTIYIAPPQQQPRTSSHSARYEEQRSITNNAAQQLPQVSIVTYPATASSASLNRNYAASENYANNAGSASYIPSYVDASGSAYGRNARYGQQFQQQQRPSLRVGSSRFDGHHSSTDLSSLISESERRAREQALSRRAHGSGIVEADYGRTAAGSSAYDELNANALGAGYGAGRVGGNGGFLRTKSWENNEKWSSGTNYDELGRPRTYSTLSTGESELHNVNGYKAGYKAATSTLEDDGKVSTFSLHT